MLRNKLKTMDEKVPDLEPLLQMVDHHKGDQVHDERDLGLTIPMHVAHYFFKQNKEDLKQPLANTH